MFPYLFGFVFLIKSGFENVISRILKAQAPADAAKSSNYTKSQLAYSICDGRYKVNAPRTSVSLPIQLFHPAFAHFLDNTKNDNFLFPDDIIRQTAEYMIAATAIYPSEEARRNALTPLLRSILDVEIVTMLNEDKTSPDGVVELGKTPARSLLLVKEDKMNSVTVARIHQLRLGCLSVAVGLNQGYASPSITVVLGFY